MSRLTPKPTPRPQLVSQAGQDSDEPQRIVPLLYTLHDAGLLLACSRHNISRLIDAGELTAVGLGRLRRVPHASIMAFIERNRVEVR